MATRDGARETVEFSEGRSGADQSTSGSEPTATRLGPPFQVEWEVVQSVAFWGRVKRENRDGGGESGNIRKNA
jgi:hypothetical protein